MDHVAVQLLEACEYFKTLSREHCVDLSNLCAKVEVTKQNALFLEGKRGQAVFLLAEGSIQLVKTSEDGKDVVIRIVEPGELFAEVVLFEQDTYPVTALALKPCTVYKIPRQDLLRLLDDREFREEFITGIMKRLRYLANRILALSAYDVETRFFQFLEEQYGKKDEYQLTLSKKDLAAAIGATPETLSRLIDRLTNDDRISWEGKILRVL